MTDLVEMMEKPASKPKEIIALLTSLKLKPLDDETFVHAESLQKIRSAINDLLALDDVLEASEARSFHQFSVSIIQADDRYVLSHSDEDIMAHLNTLSFLLMHHASKSPEVFDIGPGLLLELSLIAVDMLLRSQDSALLLVHALMEFAASYDACIEERIAQLPSTETETLRSEHVLYLGCRIHVAWKDKKLEVAEIMFQHLNANVVFAIEIEVFLMQLYYNIGIDLLRSADFYLSILWQQRAFALARSVSQKSERIHFPDLELPISEALGVAQAYSDQPGYQEAANQLAAEIEERFPHAWAPHMIRIVCLRKNPSPYSEVYASVVSRMLQKVKVTDVVLQCSILVFSLWYNVDRQMASRALGEFLVSHVYSSGDWEWIEVALIKRVWFEVDQSGSDEAYDDTLSATVVHFQSHFQASMLLSSNATAALYMLLWKQVEICANYKNLDRTLEICELAIPEPFGKLDSTHRAVFERKAVDLCIQTGRYKRANEIMSNMDCDLIFQPHTEYLTYRLGIGIGSDHAAEAHFHELEKSLREGGNTAFLRACAEVAEKGSRRTLAIRALTSIVANMKENDEHTANFAAVKTSIVCLLWEEVQDSLSDGASTESLAETFDKVARVLEKQLYQIHSQEVTGWIEEKVRWLLYKAYNFFFRGLECKINEYYIRTMNRLLVLLRKQRWLASRSHGAINGDGGDEDSEQAAAERVSRFESDLGFASATYHQLSETEKHSVIRRQCSLFLKEIHDEATKTDDILEDNGWLELLPYLLKRYFEALVYLEKWDEAAPILKVYGKFLSIENGAAMVNVLIESTTSDDKKFELLWMISKTMSEDNDCKPLDLLQRVVKVTRSLYDLAISLEALATNEKHQHERRRQCDDMVHKIVEIAQKAKTEDPSEESNTSDVYKSADLQWITATIFNQAIDEYIAGNSETCQRLTDQSLALADCMFDDGAYKLKLMGKLQAMGAADGC